MSVKHLVVCAILLIIIYPFVRVIDYGASIGTISYIVPVYDARISDALQQQISHHIDLCKSTSYNPKFLLDHLRETFDIIESLALTTYAADIAFLEVRAYNPLASINNDLVLIDRPALAHETMYEKQVVSQLESFMVANQQALENPALLEETYAVTAPQKILDNFMLTFYSEYYLLLKHRESNYALICDRSTLNTRLIEQADALYAQNNPDQIAWLLDIRFEDQIIVKRGMRGTYG